MTSRASLGTGLSSYDLTDLLFFIASITGFIASSFFFPLFSERTYRIVARPALHAKPAMSELRELSPSDSFTGKDPRQNDIKYRGLCIHAACGDSQDGYQPGSFRLFGFPASAFRRFRSNISHKKHCPRKDC